MRHTHTRARAHTHLACRGPRPIARGGRAARSSPRDPRALQRRCRRTSSPPAPQTPPPGRCSRHSCYRRRRGCTASSRRAPAHTHTRTHARAHTHTARATQDFLSCLCGELTGRRDSATDLDEELLGGAQHTLAQLLRNPVPRHHREARLGHRLVPARCCRCARVLLPRAPLHPRGDVDDGDRGRLRHGRPKNLALSRHLHCAATRADHLPPSLPALAWQGVQGVRGTGAASERRGAELSTTGEFEG